MCKPVFGEIPPREKIRPWANQSCSRPMKNHEPNSRKPTTRTKPKRLPQEEWRCCASWTKWFSSRSIFPRWIVCCCCILPPCLLHCIGDRPHGLSRCFDRMSSCLGVLIFGKSVKDGLMRDETRSQIFERGRSEISCQKRFTTDHETNITTDHK